MTGSVHFRPRVRPMTRASRFRIHRSHTSWRTVRAHPLWSAEYLSYYRAPPHHYGQIDFEGGGRILMDFTDLDVGEVDSGTAMEMVFRIKDIDERRHFTRYFWKATPVRAASAT